MAAVIGLMGNHHPVGGTVYCYELKASGAEKGDLFVILEDALNAADRAGLENVTVTAAALRQWWRNIIGKSNIPCIPFEVGANKVRAMLLLATIDPQQVIDYAIDQVFI